MPSILALDKISKRFGAIVIADALDLALAEGEALGIIGPNGAGKTTLFGIITGTVAPDAGRVLFAGGRTEAECYDHCIDLLARTGLLAKANRPAGRLTLLERKRLELARALATRPRLLLLDEIAGGLTEHECQELIATIRAIHAAGTAIIWIEHVVHALMAAVDRLLVLHNGGFIASGEPQAVIKSPAVADIYMGIAADA